MAVGVAAASAAAAAGAAASSDRRSQPKNKAKGTNPTPIPSNMLSEDSSLIQSTLDNEISQFKEIIDQKQFFKPKNTDFPIEETGRVLGQAFAHQSLDVLQKQAASNPQFYKELRETSLTKTSSSIEITFSKDNSTYSVRNPDLGVEGDFHLLRGDRALELHSYDQAIYDFSKVIEQNPGHPDAYLDRAFAHLYKGNFQEAL